MSLVGMFHVGIVVPDLDDARERLGALLDLRWGPIVEHPQLELRDGDGRDFVGPLRLCYSTAFPHIELIEELPGSVWACNEHSNLHHIGFYSDALGDDSDGLRAARCPLVLCGRDGSNAPYGFTLQRDPLGLVIELVDATTREASEAFLMGTGEPG